MITTDPYGIRHAIKPGYGEPLSSEPIDTHDPPEYVDKCLSCPVIGDCNSALIECPLNPKSRARDGKDEKVLKLISAGWRNNDAICKELGISKSTLSLAKRRLRARGDIL